MLLFGLCGAASCRLFSEAHGWDAFLLPIPFGVVSWFLFLRSAKAILVVPLHVLVWAIAYYIAMVLAVSITPQSDYFPMCAAGFVGGAGVFLASGIADERLLSWRCLLGACLVGCTAALPFGLWLAEKHAAIRLSMNAHEDTLQPLRLQCSYAIWQAGVGTYLYTVCTVLKRKADSETANR